jgi:hypothetical protein
MNKSRNIIMASRIIHIFELSTPPTILWFGTEAAVGMTVGRAVGACVGETVGEDDGIAEGVADGIDEGSDDGIGVANTRTGSSTTATSKTGLLVTSVRNCVYPTLSINKPVEPVWAGTCT